MNFKTLVAMILVFVACCFNVITLEYLVKYSSGCGQLVTFAQFIFIAFYGFVSVAKFGTRRSVVPIREYVLAVFLFYTSTISGNMALGCHISMPIQMIFKAGSVLASMALGVLLLKRSYPTWKYAAVAMITIGISMCLLIAADDKKGVNESGSLAVWIFGIGLLFASLFLGASLGIKQERISLEYGKHPEEMLFYTHVLALPAFAFFSKNILHQITIFNEAELHHIPMLGIGIPYIWFYLLANVFTQFLCIKSVYVLCTEMSALAVNVLLTLRKFTSLVLSILYFRNPFTVYHWCGSLLVFTGTLLFSGVLHDIFGVAKEDKPKKKEE